MTNNRDAVLNRLSFDLYVHLVRPAIINALSLTIMKEPKTKQEKNHARLKHLRGRAGRWD